MTDPDLRLVGGVGTGRLMFPSILRVYLPWREATVIAKLDGEGMAGFVPLWSALDRINNQRLRAYSQVMSDQHCVKIVFDKFV